MGLRNFFKREKGGSLSLSTRNATTHPFSQLMNYVPLKTAQDDLYESLREAVPIVDAAISKLARLIGGFTVHVQSPAAKRQLDEFVSSVRVGAGGVGLDSFLCAYTDSLLTYGNALGEIVLDQNSKDIFGLYNCSTSGVEIKKEQGGLSYSVYQRDGSGKASKVPRQELVLFSALNPKPSEVVGTSLLKGLPFVSSILLKIFSAIGQNFDRMGNLRFAITYKPGGDELDRSFAKERAEQIAAQWGAAMSDSSGIHDFISVGDVEIKAIGADAQVLDSNIPVRQILEQIISKLSIPPFLLGLSWSSTERMSRQQADILTSELESYRRILTPVILKICKVFLMLKGYNMPVSVEWENINMQDEIEIAKTRLLHAQAAEIERRNTSDETSH